MLFGAVMVPDTDTAHRDNTVRPKLSDTTLHLDSVEQRYF